MQRLDRSSMFRLIASTTQACSSRAGLVTALCSLIVLAAAGCSSKGKLRREQRLYVAYVRDGALLSKTSNANGNFPSTAEVAVPAGLGVRRFSIAQFSQLMWAAWMVPVYDALGGGPLFKIRVTAIPASAHSITTLRDGGLLGVPVLVAHDGSLHCFWTSGSTLRHRATSDGQQWSAEEQLAVPDGHALLSLDATVHRGRIYLAGFVQISSGTMRVFAGTVQRGGASELSWVTTGWISEELTHRPPPETPAAGFAVASDGSTLTLVIKGANQTGLFAIESSDGFSNWGEGYELADYRELRLPSATYSSGQLQWAAVVGDHPVINYGQGTGNLDPEHGVQIAGIELLTSN